MAELPNGRRIQSQKGQQVHLERFDYGSSEMCDGLIKGQRAEDQLQKLMEEHSNDDHILECCKYLHLK
jgi:hypothetical protein